MDRQLKEKAKKMRVPVSNLVRSILEDTLTMVEGLTENVTQLVEDFVEDASEIRKSVDRVKAVSVATRLAQVVAWQEVTLNKPTRCLSCQKEIESGAPAHLGVSEQLKEKVFLCPPCLEKLSREEEKTPEPDWSEALINREMACRKCGRELPRGTKALLAQVEGEGFVACCLACGGRPDN